MGDRERNEWGRGRVGDGAREGVREGGSERGEGDSQDPGLRTQDSTQSSVRITHHSPVVVGISGASGAALAKRAIEKLGEAGYPVIATCTSAGQRVWKEELDESYSEFVQHCQTRFVLESIDVRDIGASIASGRRLTMGMLVVPCSMDMVSAIACGRSTNLLERAADVTLKEARLLVLVPRESPLSPIHLENMLKLSRIGVRVVLPVPAFYLRPQTVEEVVDDVVTRALWALGIRDVTEEMTS